MSAMLRRSRWSAVALAAALAVPLSAEAHRAWLLPSHTVLSGDDPWVSVDAAISNDLFYPDHVPMRTEGLAVYAPDGSKGSLENSVTGKYRSTCDVHLTRPGTWKIASASDGLMASYVQGGERKRWRGSAAELATAIPADAQEVRVVQAASRNETFVTRGAPTTDALKPTGAGLELAPITHPNDLFSGEAASFRLLLDGKPAPNVDVTVIPGAARYRDTPGEVKVKTGADGVFKVTWPEPGMYWINASVEGGAGPVPNSVRRASYTATLEVLRP